MSHAKAGGAPRRKRKTVPGRCEPSSRWHCSTCGDIALPSGTQSAMMTSLSESLRQACAQLAIGDTNMLTSVRLADLNKRIIELVHDCWDDHHKPLLLSRLGNRDRGEIARLVRQHSSNLQSYLHSYLSDNVKVVQHSVRPELVGAVPSHAELSAKDDVDSALETTVNESTATATRYHPAFWAAFRIPLDESNNRYMSTRTPIRFHDAPGDRPDGFIQIASNYVVGPDAEYADVQQKVQEWLAENKLQPTLYASMVKASGSEKSVDLLDRLLHALDPSDLERITMPLDIVLKLKRQSP